MNTQLKEALKIGVSCLFGGMIGVLIALMVMPHSWKLGLLAGLSTGFIVGYFSYQVKQVLQAIPKAWKATVASSMTGWSNVKKVPGAIIGIVIWIWQHPFIIFLTVLHLTAWTLGVLLLETRDTHKPVDGWLWLVISSIFVWFFYGFYTVSETVEYIYDKHPSKWSEQAYLKESFIGYSWTSIWKINSWIVRQLALFFFWRVPCFLVTDVVPGIWKVIAFILKFAVKFMKNLFLLIHSKQRLICGVDSAIGCGVAYMWLAEPGMSTMQTVTTIVCGGLLGAAFGIFNWEIVSKKWLKLHLPKPAEA